MSSTKIETPSLVERVDPFADDRFIVLQNISWDQYVAIGDILGEDHPSVRMIYLQGTLEIMTKGPRHESKKKTLARLLEFYALEKDITLNGYGEMTRRKEAAERGLEPDECYLVGWEIEEEDESKLEIPPDIALEISITSGFLDKLEVYRGLEVPEVWFWRNDRIVVHRLIRGKYKPRSRSQFLPDLDLEVLARHAAIRGQTAAVRAFRDWLRRAGP